MHQVNEEITESQYDTESNRIDSDHKSGESDAVPLFITITDIAINRYVTGLRYRPFAKRARVLSCLK